MRFEKVSLDAWMYQCEKLGIDPFIAKGCYDNIQIPKRSTSGSCGYDFVCPIDCIVTPEKVTMIPTGIRVFLDDDKFLMLTPRSSCVKKGFAFPASLGIIDADYINADNEGNIMVPVISTGKVNWIVKFNIGDKIAQGIIVPFFKVEEEEVTTERTGGFGSTGESIKEEDTTNEEPTKLADNSDIDSLFEEFERKVEVNNTESKPEEEDEDKTEEPVNDGPEEIKEEGKEKESLLRFNSHIFIDANIVNKTIVEEIRNMMDVIKTKDPNVFINIIELKNNAKSLDDIVYVYNKCSAYLSNLNDKHILSDFYLRDAYINVLNSNYTKLSDKLLNEIYKIINIIRYEKKVEDKKLLDVGKMIYDKFKTIDNDEKLESFINELDSLVLSD